jgi:hypothetical protein
VVGNPASWPIRTRGEEAQRRRLPRHDRGTGHAGGLQQGQGLGTRPHRRRHHVTGPYQQDAAAALRTKTIVWSIVHGEATSPRFQQGFDDAVETYDRSRDPKTFSATLTDALNQQPPAK